MFPSGRCEALKRGSALGGIKSLGKQLQVLPSVLVTNFPANCYKPHWTALASEADLNFLRLLLAAFLLPPSLWWGLAGADLVDHFAEIRGDKLGRMCKHWAQGTDTWVCSVGEESWGERQGKSTGAELSATRYMAAPCFMRPGAAAVMEGSNDKDHNYTPVSKACDA